MKFAAISILILLAGAQTFNKWIVILGYEANKKYIAENLCENRARPAMKCNGRCFLMKKMKAQEKQESSPGVIHWGETGQLFVNTFPDFTCVSLKKPPVKSFIRNSSLYKTDFIYSVFRPPLS